MENIVRYRVIDCADNNELAYAETLEEAKKRQQWSGVKTYIQTDKGLVLARIGCVQHFVQKKEIGRNFFLSGGMIYHPYEMEDAVIESAVAEYFN